MSYMYVANASFFRVEFHYWLSGQKKRRTMVIEPMSQIRLPDDLDMKGVGEIVNQHEPFGFIKAGALTLGTTPKEKTNLVYNLDEPVTAIMIEHLWNINKGILDQFGRQLRREAAIVTNQTLLDSLEKQRQQGLDATVDSVETTIQEEEPPGGYGEKDPIGEGYVVTEGKDDQPIPMPRRGLRR